MQLRVAHLILRQRRRLRTSAYVSIRQHTSASVSIRQHTSASVSIIRRTTAAKLCSSLLIFGIGKLKTRAFGLTCFSGTSVRLKPPLILAGRAGITALPVHTSAYVSIRYLACVCVVCVSAYVSIRPHTAAYVSIRQHTSASAPAGITVFPLCMWCVCVWKWVSIHQHTLAYVSIRQHTS